MTCEIIKLILVTLLGSGAGTAIVGFYLKANIDKSLHRYSQIFTNNLIIVKSIYKDLVSVEEALEKYLISPPPKDTEGREKFNNDTIRQFDNFIKNFKENEIILDDNEVELINDVIKLIKDSKDVFLLSEMAEGDRASRLWQDAANKKANLQKEWQPKFQTLRNKLKKSFQEKYDLILQ